MALGTISSLGVGSNLDLQGTLDKLRSVDNVVVTALQDKATYEKPMESPTGIEWVLVNGVVTMDHGKHTGAKAGRVLWGPGAR